VPRAPPVGTSRAELGVTTHALVPKRAARGVVGWTLGVDCEREGTQIDSGVGPRAALRERIAPKMSDCATRVSRCDALGTRWHRSIASSEAQGNRSEAQGTSRESIGEGSGAIVTPRGSTRVPREAICRIASSILVTCAPFGGGSPSIAGVSAALASVSASIVTWLASIARAWDDPRTRRAAIAVASAAIRAVAASIAARRASIGASRAAIVTPRASIRTPSDAGGEPRTRSRNRSARHPKRATPSAMQRSY
jgi:hypothetical protein